MAALPLPRTGLSGARRLGVVLGRFLLLEGDGALWILDLVGAAQRVKYEAEARAPLGAAQALLVPLELEADPGRLARLEGATTALARVGLEVRLDGDRATLHAAPASARGLDYADLVDAALEAVETAEPVEPAVRARVAASRARTAASGSVPREPEAVEALVAALEGCEVRDRGIEGRPLVVALSATQLGALFGGTA